MNDYATTRAHVIRCIRRRLRQCSQQEISAVFNLMFRSVESRPLPYEMFLLRFPPLSRRPRPQREFERN